MKFKELFLKRTMLQFFADDDNGGDGGAGDGGSGDKGGQGDSGGAKADDKPKEITMTQKEYDKKIQSRLDRGKKAWEKEFHESDDYKAFQKYQDGQKDEKQKMQESLKGMNDIKSENDSLKAKIAGFEQSDAIRKAEVNDEFVDFVKFEVNKTLDKFDGDFDDALKAFKENEKNAKYFGASSNGSKSQGKRHGGKGGEINAAAALVSKMYGGK